MKKQIISKVFLIFIAITCHSNFSIATEQIYYPHPIIFVHGLDGKISDWNFAKRNLDGYFKNELGYKYPLQDSSYDYFPYCDYGWQNKGDIPSIAITSLKGNIDSALKSFPSEVPEDDRKIIIVAHSMGGLVTRSFLKQDSKGYYASKIDKVVFIGTPHLGSPLADSIWLLNKVRQEIINPAVIDYSVFYSQNIGTRFKFSDRSSIMQINGLPSEANNYLLTALAVERTWLNNALSYSDRHGFTGSRAIEQLKINQDVKFQKTIIWTLGPEKASIELKASTIGSNTFIGRASENLANPSNFKIISGVNPYPSWQKAYDVLITHIYTLYNNNFIFPAELSMDDVLDPGDGIVPQRSQNGIGGADYFVSAFHTDEPKEYETILKAIDDKPPEIERVYAVPCDWSEQNLKTYYVVIKAKEYLLADLEIESMDLDGEPVDLKEFKDTSGTEIVYKPYVKFGKKFLQQRNDDPNIKDKDGKFITLEPGEFYVKITLPFGSNYGSYNNRGYIFNVKLKNPAGKTKQERITIYKPTADYIFNSYIIDVDPYFPPPSKLPQETSMTTFDVITWLSSKIDVEVGVCAYDSYRPFIILDNNTGNSTLSLQPLLPDHPEMGYSGSFSNFITWNGSDKKGEVVPQNQDYKIRVALSPEHKYAKPSIGDNEMEIPVYIWRGAIRADPTFIQSRRGYSKLAKFENLNKFNRYGYNVKSIALNPSQESSSLLEYKNNLGTKTLIAFKYQLSEDVSRGYCFQLDAVNKTIGQEINAAISGILKIEDDFDIEKQKLTSKIEAEAGDLYTIQAFKENNAPEDLVRQLEEKNSQSKAQKLSSSLEQLAQNKERRVSSVINNANNSILALIEKVSSETVASNLMNK